MINCFLKVTIDLPSEGVQLDRVTLPDNVNIKTVRVYYRPEGRNSLLPINNDKVGPLFVVGGGDGGVGVRSVTFFWYILSFFSEFSSVFFFLMCIIIYYFDDPRIFSVRYLHVYITRKIK